MFREMLQIVPNYIATIFLCFASELCMKALVQFAYIFGSLSLPLFGFYLFFIFLSVHFTAKQCFIVQLLILYNLSVFMVIIGHIERISVLLANLE